MFTLRARGARSRSMEVLVKAMVIIVFASIVLSFVAALFVGCSTDGAVRPANRTERVYIEQVVLIAAANAVANLRGKVDDDDYDNGVKVIRAASTAIACTRVVYAIPGSSTCTNREDAKPVTFPQENNNNVWVDVALVAVAAKQRAELQLMTAHSEQWGQYDQRWAAAFAPLDIALNDALARL